jgi:inner membrane transporter RhtA
LGVAVAIEFLGPLSVALVGSLRRVDLLWVALAVAGILALTRGPTHGLDELGIALALLAGVFWGAYILLNVKLGQAFDGATGVALAMCAAAVAIAPVGVAAAGSHLLEPRSLALGTAVGVLSSTIPYSLEVEALRRIAPAVFGVLMSLEPALAALAGFLVLGQSLDLRGIAGIGLVVLAGASRRSNEPAPILA